MQKSVLLIAMKIIGRECKREREVECVDRKFIFIDIVITTELFFTSNSYTKTKRNKLKLKRKRKNKTVPSKKSHAYRQGEERKEEKLFSADCSMPIVYLFFFLLLAEGGGERAERLRDPLDAAAVVSLFDAIPFFLFRPPLSES